jgi:hypothetical protein
LSGSNVIIAWTAPASNGLSITAYDIQIRESDDTTFSADSTHCDGS